MTGQNTLAKWEGLAAEARRGRLRGNLWPYFEEMVADVRALMERPAPSKWLTTTKAALYVPQCSATLAKYCRQALKGEGPFAKDDVRRTPGKRGRWMIRWTAVEQLMTGGQEDDNVTPITGWPEYREAS